MHVTIVICTWNRSELLRQTLKQLTALKAADEISWDVFVINNNSTDNTPAVLESFRPLLPLSVYSESKPGLSNARNAALERATADYLFFTDDDVLVDPEWLTEFAALLRRHPEADAVGGPMEPWFPEPPDPVLLAAFPALASGFCVRNEGMVEGVVADPATIQGGNMVLRRATILGLRFNARLGYSPTSQRGGEETEFLANLQKRGGIVVWCPRIKVRHYVAPWRMTLSYMRQFSVGIGQETVRKSGVPEGTRLWGAPRWLWRRCVEAYGRYLLLRVRSERLAALLALRDHCMALGMLKECRHLSRQLQQQTRVA